MKQNQIKHAAKLEVQKLFTNKVKAEHKEVTRHDNLRVDNKTELLMTERTRDFYNSDEEETGISLNEMK